MSDLIDPVARQALCGDAVARGIVVAALLFFVTFAAEAVPSAVGVLRDRTSAPDGVLAAPCSLTSPSSFSAGEPVWRRRRPSGTNALIVAHVEPHDRRCC